MRDRRTSSGLVGLAQRHRVATTFLALFLMASPGRPDDRQLLQANAGANTNVLLILDSSHSMNNDFSDQFRLPAYMDDFIYPQGTVATNGSKLAVAKSVLREVLSKSSNVNWAFSYYRNPGQVFGADDTSVGDLGRTPPQPPAGFPIGGATTAGQPLKNGGLEWLYLADCDSDQGNTVGCNGPVSDTFTAVEYPDIQNGRFLQLGHKVMANFGGDSRPPYPGAVPGTWRGSFGPSGDCNRYGDCSAAGKYKVIYRNSGSTGKELRMYVIQGDYSDQFIWVQMDEYGPPGTPTATVTNTPTVTRTRTATATRTATLTPSSTRTATATSTQTSTPTATRTPVNTFTNTRTPTVTSTASNTPTRTATFTPSRTSTPSQTATLTQTRTQTATSTRTFTPSITPTFTPTFTVTRTFTPSQTATRTATFTPSQTPTRTFTPSNTATATATFTPTRTFTPSQTPTRTNTFTATNTATRTFTPSITPTFTRTATATQTFTPSRTATTTQTFTRTATATQTFTPSRTATATATFTASNTATRTFTPSRTATATQTFTPSNTATRTATATATATATRTFTPSNTPIPPTNTNTATRTNTPIPPTNTFTRTNTPIPPTNTFTRTNTPIPPTNTRTATATNTPTGTPPPTPTRTPTLVPTLPGGHFPGGSLLPAVANWLAPAVRGLFAMAPPPPPLPPTGPCPGIPASYTGPGQLQCAPCPFDATEFCAFVDNNANGIIDAGDFAPSLLNTLPEAMRGFDDPQADPDPTLVPTGRQITVRYERADMYQISGSPYSATASNANGNPPWGSQVVGDPPSVLGPVPDFDADATNFDSSSVDRRNRGMYTAIYDKTLPRPNQQFPNDAFAGPSCPLGKPTCDPTSEDCGGLARFADFTTLDGVSYAGKAPNALIQAPNGSPYTLDEPPKKDEWPVVPFKRDWAPYNATDYQAPGPTPDLAIERLLRFASSIVSYNASAAQPIGATGYTLAEDSKEVVVTAPGTPLAGGLQDAYNYFNDSVFPTPSGGTQDPAINCRNYIIVFVTDGHDECSSDPCPIATSLGSIPLPEFPPGARAAAQSFDPSIRTNGIPVYVVGMSTDAAFFPTLNCIANNSGGKLFAASDRTTLEGALESILDFKRNANFFAAPAIPAFAGGLGDSAQIGAVIPSHLNPNGDLSNWSVWSGSLKSFQLNSQGLIPVVTAGPPTATAVPTAGGPTATPVVFTPTPMPTPIPGSDTFPDESTPDDPDPLNRKPVWNAARVLGYTDPVANLAANAGAVAASPASRAPSITVWPGRKMIFGRVTAAGVPLTRADLLPRTGTCMGACFDDLMIDMGLTPGQPNDQTLAIRTVQFLRGGITPFGRRDEVLNLVKPSTVGTIGPNAGEEQKFSYFYQDDAPNPGSPPQQRTDDDGAVPAGYAHKLGDIFHSEPLLLDTPKYFQYVSLDLNDYVTFANTQSKRRRVLFVGANDGFLHAFDAGVYGRDTTNFPTAHDLGTGREIFAYAPRQVMDGKFPSLLSFPPLPQYFVDGSMGAADVFIDPVNNGANPTASERVWRSVIVGGLRQGGAGYFALDVTQPDDIDAAGLIVGNKDASPGCLAGAGASCTAGASVSSRQYPEILWELRDPGLACSDGCSGPAGAPAAMGETWSRPFVGRIKIINGASFEDRYVAIFGGGYDSSFNPGDNVATKLPKGRALYIVDVETGAILYKTTQGVDGTGATVDFAPMPGAAAVGDYDDDGYLDVAYIGDVNGHMWRINLTPDATQSPKVGELQAGPPVQLHGYQPFLLFDACSPAPAPPQQCSQPIFYEPGLVYVGGAGSPPVLGIAFGTGNRANLTEFKSSGNPPNSFFYVLDSGQQTTSFVKSDLQNLTPGACSPGACPPSTNGFVLDFSSLNEKTTSTVVSTQGYLSLLTFTPDSVTPCATNGSSFRYRFFFLNGQGKYGTTGTYADFQENLGEGLATASQSTSPQGDTIDTVLFSGSPLTSGAAQQKTSTGTINTIDQNWKEQQ